MDVVGHANEIIGLNNEIKSLRSLLKEKNARFIELKETLDCWLEKTGQTTVPHNGQILYRVTKKTACRLTKDEKTKNALEVLQSLGVRDCKLVLEKLKEAQKGEMEERTEVKIDNEKDYHIKQQRKSRKERARSGRSGR